MNDGLCDLGANTADELGLELKGVHTALNVEKGMELLKDKIGSEDAEEIEEDHEDSVE